MTYLIKVNNLCKNFMVQKREQGLRATIKEVFHREYEIKEAVKDISFEVQEGEIVGYLGPNGAGKSTTIKMLAGILIPTSGNISVNGIEPSKNRIVNAKQIGVVFGQRSQLWWDIPVCETLNLMRYMYKIPDSIYRQNIQMFNEILDLQKFVNMPARQLSLGQRMRADFACALLHNPKVLYLDEPTIGLDVFVKENIREFIKEINARLHTTIVLTTHDMFDVEKLCSRVMVIHNGKLMYNGNIDSLRKKYGTIETIDIELSDINMDLEPISRLQLEDIKHEGNKLSISYNNNYVNSTSILTEFLSQNKVKDFKVHESNIDDIIREMYQELNKHPHEEEDTAV